MDYRSQACGDWISFTVVAILALTASGVGMDSCPESPGGHNVNNNIVHPVLYLLLYNYNLNLLLMALHEHPTFYYWPTSTSIRLVSPFPSCITAIRMGGCFGRDIVIT